MIGNSERLRQFPELMGAEDISRYINYLAVKRNVAGSTYFFIRKGTKKKWLRNMGIA
jgi:hypothetical protein